MILAGDREEYTAVVPHSKSAQGAHSIIIILNCICSAKLRNEHDQLRYDAKAVYDKFKDQDEQQENELQAKAEENLPRQNEFMTPYSRSPAENRPRDRLKQILKQLCCARCCMK